jgi:hypothetical protein
MNKVICLGILSLVSLFTIIFFSTCSGPKIFKLGSNYGGIIENSDPDASSGATTPVDAVSGATQAGTTISFQQTFLFKGHTFQTGIDYVSHRQRITYVDTLYAIDGRRTFHIHQLRVPLLYNINLLRDFDKVPTIILHMGLSGGVTLTPGITEELRLGLPGYTFTSVDIGPQLGVTLQPLQLDYHHYLGLYADFYRGTRIYKDKYHKDKGVGNLSFFKVGALLYFR